MKLSALFVTMVLGACGGGVDDEGIGGDCTRGCQATVAADCDNGPSLSECVSDCNDQAVGECGAEFIDLLACGDGEAVTCDPNENPVVEACSTEQDAFVACLNG
jgi:hypothetical protein